MPTRPADAATARKFGAEGIGLCRTEHMFFDADRIIAVRQMILADAEDERKAALAKLLPMQRGDFEAIFQEMAGLPVTIRLLDPPLHEFLPHKDEEIEEVARAAGTDPAKLRARAIALHEANPMLGHRGCRLGITYPGNLRDAGARHSGSGAECGGRRAASRSQLEIMIPLVAFKSELDGWRRASPRSRTTIKQERGKVPDYLIGTMIELPRAALRAGEIAETARILFLRHQRSHPDHVGRVSATMPACS